MATSAATTSSAGFGIALRQAQRDALLNMLNFNAQKPANHNEATSITWKILIYDTVGQEIISPLLKVNELRELAGVTLHMHINTHDRQPLSDVPAVYFVEPTKEMIRKILDDISKNLYESYYINFTSSLSRSLLEELAAASIANDAYTQISQVYDQYLNFQTLDRNLFSLNVNQSYKLLNDSTTPDSVIENTIARTVDGLFAVFATMNAVPLIRSSRGNAAEMVASKLDTKLRDHLNSQRSTTSTNDLFSGDTLSRPLLVLVDRNVDLCSMLSHTWTYASLVHDILDMRLNRVVVNGDTGRKVYDLDPMDFFWSRNSHNPFPQVAEDVDAEINKYKKEVEEVTRSAGVSSLDQIGDDPTNTALLKTAISQLPQLTERKRIIDMHMSIATSLLKSIQERKLDRLFEAEEGVAKLTKQQLLEILLDPTINEHDKLRLFLIYYLSLPLDTELSKEDMNEYHSALVGGGCDLACVEAAKKVRSFGRIVTGANVTGTSGNTGDLLGKFTSFGNKLTDQLKDGGLTNLGSAYTTLISGVKNLIPSRKDLPLTRVVDFLTSTPSSTGDDDGYTFFDPRVRSKSTRKGNTPTQYGGTGVSFGEVVVCVVGGGNFVEWVNLNEWAQRNKKRIAYGATEIITAKQFLDQMSSLGQTQ